MENAANRENVMNGPDRRTLLKATGAAALAALASDNAAAQSAQIVGSEYWAQKGDVKLYLWRKRVDDGKTDKPVIFFVHGSSFSGRAGYDLQVPGHPDYSAMDHFAGLGYDVWTIDHEGYGKSSRNTGTNSGIMIGVADLEAAMPIVERETGRRKIFMRGQSSGAIRLGVFAMRNPDRVEKIILDALTWTGEGAPEIMRRRRDAEQYRTQNYRPMSRQSFLNIFSRDDPSTFEQAVAIALADYEAALGDRAPSGTYLDMAVNMPMVDPTKLTCPVMMIRAEHDGNSTEAELIEFFTKLPNKEKQFVMLKGSAHLAMLGKGRRRAWHVTQAFFTLPPPAEA